MGPAGKPAAVSGMLGHNGRFRVGRVRCPSKVTAGREVPAPAGGAPCAAHPISERQTLRGLCTAPTRFPLPDPAAGRWDGCGAPFGPIVKGVGRLQAIKRSRQSSTQTGSTRASRFFLRFWRITQRMSRSCTPNQASMRALPSEGSAATATLQQ